MYQQFENRSEQISYMLLPYKSYRTYDFDKSSSLSTELINEINEIDPEDQASINEPSFLEIKLTMKRQEHLQYEHYAIIKGQLKGHYYTPCIKCLIPTYIPINADFSTLLLLNQFESDPDIEDQDTFLMENEEHDLYFFDGKTLPLKDVVREQLVMCIDLYPVHSKDCKGLCPTCGINRNNQTCSHGN